MLHRSAFWGSPNKWIHNNRQVVPISNSALLLIRKTALVPMAVGGPGRLAHTLPLLGTLSVRGVKWVSSYGVAELAQAPLSGVRF